MICIISLQGSSNKKLLEHISADVYITDRSGSGRSVSFSILSISMRFYQKSTNLFVKSFESLTEFTDEVFAGVSFTCILGREAVSGIAMNPNTEKSGITSGITSGKEPSHKAGQDITASALCHSGVSGGILEDLAVR
jgi:hypothetical protein